MRPSPRRVVSYLLIGTLILIALAFASGRVSLDVTSGVSMEPSHHAGDLVVVTAAGSYHQGDVVAYHGGADGTTTVLHRIVGGDGDGFVLKGDNNESVDPLRPTLDEVIGREVVVIPSIGGVMRSPLVRGLLVALTIALAGVLMLKPHRVTTPTPARSPSASPRTAGGRAGSKVRFVLLAVDAILLVAVIVAFAFPSPAPAATATGSTQTGALAYAATVPVSDTYPTGQIVTGDPVFVKLLTSVDVGFRYDTAGPTVPVIGTGRLDAVLSAPSGWHMTLPLTQATPVAGGTLALAGTLDLMRIRAIGDNVAQATGTPLAAITVVVTASVDLAVDGLEPTTFSVELPLQLTTLALTISAVKPTPSADGPAVSRRAPLETGPIPAPAPASGATHQQIAYGLLGALVLFSGATVIVWPSGEDADVDGGRPSTLTAVALDSGNAPRLKLHDRAALDAVAFRLARPLVQVGDHQLVVVAPDAVYWIDTP